MGLSGSYGAADEATSLRTLHFALEAGVSLLDTADFYGAGANEELVGRAIAGRRDEVVVATKTGVRRGPSGMGVDGTPDHLRSACEASLRRLGVERIDMYTLARIDPGVPVEESIGAMAELVSAGKVAHLGLSEASAKTLRRACATHPIAALQSEYSLWERGVEADVLPTCRELGVGFIAYSPLGRGFLTGTVTNPAQLAEADQRRNHPRFQEGNIDRNAQLIAPVIDLAHTLGAEPAQVALAWLLARGTEVVPIPGSRSTRHLASNLAAMDLTLTQEQLAHLDAALPPGATAGARYPQPVMATLDQS
jgi:aryl-alcohol dehydrogenase-like predicted oxidoreductase